MLLEDNSLILEADGGLIVITFSHKGNFSRTNRFLEKALNVVKLGELDKYGRQGVDALSAATPVDTGNTAGSWEYKITRDHGSATISWFNTNVSNGVNIAVILQYGHGTRNGGYVKGRDYINPAMQPVFDKIAESAWKEITII